MFSQRYVSFQLFSINYAIKCRIYTSLGHHHSSLFLFLFLFWFDHTSPSISISSILLSAISIHIYLLHIPSYSVFKSQSGPSLVALPFFQLRIEKFSRYCNVFNHIFLKLGLNELGYCSEDRLYCLL